MRNLKPISLNKAFSDVTFLADRKPDTPDEISAGAFAMLADYRDGGIFIGHYAGNSEWERHGQGDEIVMVLEGETTLFIFEDHQETPYRIGAGEMIVVPQGLWHRFETPNGVKIMSVTPSPTDHRLDHPG